jgi:hypothetical protein
VAAGVDWEQQRGSTCAQTSRATAMAVAAAGAGWGASSRGPSGHERVGQQQLLLQQLTTSYPPTQSLPSPPLGVHIPRMQQQEGSGAAAGGSGSRGGSGAAAGDHLRVNESGSSNNCCCSGREWQQGWIGSSSRTTCTQTSWAAVRAGLGVAAGSRSGAAAGRHTTRLVLPPPVPPSPPIFFLFCFVFNFISLFFS